MAQSRRHRCNICGMVSINANELSRHRQAVHVDKKFQCQSCSKIFKTRDEFGKHLVGIHGGKTQKLSVSNLGKKHRYEKEIDDVESMLLRKADEGETARKRTRGPYRKSSIA